MTQDNLQARPVVVVDFGAQYAQLIARRVREAKCFSEVVPHTMSVAQMLAKNPAAIILSGGPSSVYADGAPELDPALLSAGVPVFGMCYGFQAMAQALNGTVAHTGLGEYGATPVQIADTASTLFDGNGNLQTGGYSNLIDPRMGEGVDVLLRKIAERELFGSKVARTGTAPWAAPSSFLIVASGKN